MIKFLNLGEYQILFLIVLYWTFNVFYTVTNFTYANLLELRESS